MPGHVTRLITACVLLAAAAMPAPGGNALQPQPESSSWVDDTLLPGLGFWSYTIPLGQDYDGPVTATLVRRPRHRQRDCAVLYLHGYVDYFFSPELATFYQTTLGQGTPRKGCDFFALDLRKYGRSLPVGYKYPNFAKSLDEYFPEITTALDIIRGERYRFVLLNGHSTGALVAVRYLQDKKASAGVDAVFLNSPFLDFNDRDLKGFGIVLARTVGLTFPHYDRRSTVPLWYARALLRKSDACPDCHGRWEFRTRLKPIEGFPVFLGWVRAIAIAHGRARQGGIDQPTLILHSARSNDGTDPRWQEEYRREDLVLDVEDIKREGPKLGPHVTIRSIEGGVHDLALSDPDAQARVFDSVMTWLRTLPGHPVGP